MRIRTNISLMLSLIALTISSCSNCKTTDQSVIVDIDGGQKVRLQVVNDKIIRVSATVEDKFNNDSSLIVVPQTEKVKFGTTETDSTLSVVTKNITATVNKHTGAVCFCDAEGKAILSEDKKGGKTFTPIEVDGTQGYTVRQVWESTDDEAFYGLGQHQADEFNYKGKNEELFQYNTKVSVPFIMSNKNYGILWDNYSLSRYGDSRDYSQLNEIFKLYDKDGNEGGLTGTYLAEGKRLVRTEPFIYFENLKANRQYLPKDIKLANANVSFEGEIEPSATGLYRFILYYAGYVKVYINNELVVPERWRTAWNPNSHKFACNLEGGKRIPIRIEWKPDGGESYCGLRALPTTDDKEQSKLAFWSEMGDGIDYYFVAGDNSDDVISGYRTLTGKSQIMPKWAMGFWQSRERYKTQDEIVSTLKEFRQRRIPIDNIVLDWSYWPVDAWGGHEFDSARFQNPQAMIDSIHAMNGHMMISVWPKFYTNTEHFKEFDQKGWMYQQAVVDSIYDWIGYMGSFYDAYSADARKLFWNQMNEHLFKFGIDAWWMDASEPNVRDCTDLEYRKKLCGPTAMGPSTKYFNAYALMNAEAIYNGQRSVDNDKRVFLLTRSGFAGLQRYSTATWSGDIATRWEDMKAQIPAGINFSMSGIPYWTMDIGGFCVEKRYELGQQVFDKTGKENEDYKEWRELNTRWYQFGAFCPLFRAHGQFPLREVWNIAPENHPAYKSIVYYTNLRYQLMPYIYSLAGMTYFNDYTIMRGLIMDFGKDTNVNNIGDQYMFGPSIMVCPVYQYGATSRTVYFPSTTGWYDFYTGKHIRGGLKSEVDAPYERMPLYVREGSIIPCEQAMQYTNEKQSDYITLFVYEGQNATFTLYEDEGVNYNYEKGKYSTIVFEYDESAKTLVINNRKGEYDGMIKDRKFNVVFVQKEGPKAFSPEAQGTVVDYNGEKIVIKL